MGVYIKGFPLPNNCGACPLRLAWCRERIYMVTRPERCPLIPVPEHGRLIDADALAEHKFVCVPHVTIDGKEAGYAYRLGWNTAIEAIIENAETIIKGGE